MFAYYQCGATDCFLTAIFNSKEMAEEYAKNSRQNPEGFFICEWKTLSDIDMSDTGWNYGIEENR